MMRERARRTARFIAVALGVIPVLVLSAPAVAAQSCQNELLRSELRSGELPDCRAYEMVTPPYEEGDAVHIWAIAPEGARVLGTTFGVFAGAESDEFQGVGEATAYVITRGSSGWSAEAISPPASRFPSNKLVAVTPDVTSTLWLLRTPAQPNLQEADLYLRTEAGAFVQIGPTQAVPGESAEVTYAGASRSLSKAVFTIDASADGGAYLWPGDTTAGQGTTVPSLYEYSGTGNSEPVLVGVRNEGRLDGAPHVNEAAELISQCGTELGSGASSYNAVSASGEAVFFTARGRQSGGNTECTLGAGGVAPGFDELYARMDGSETVAISEPSPTDCGACDTSPVAEAVFQGASEDGSKVFFTTKQELLPGAGGENLYEYEIDGEVGEGKVKYVCPERPDGCVTLVSSGSSPAEVKGVARISEDGSHVYFVAGGVLTEANAEGRAPVKGADNFYVYDTLTGMTQFIATLGADDQAVWASQDRSRPVESTPDGEVLVFTSSADLTADDTSTVSQVFEYDAGTQRLERVSMGQGGYNDNGNTTEESDAARIGIIGATLPDFGEGIESTKTDATRALSADGSRVFFESAEALTPQTVPGLPGNVYEWEREGTGSCPVGEGEGCVYLISDGRDASTTFKGASVKLLATDASGEDAFFTTADQLVQRDTDTQLDVYDARVEGGFAEPGTLSECGGSACQGPLDLAPAVPPVATATSEDEAPATASAKPTTTKPAVLTRAQKLARALRSCRAVRAHARRQSCEAHARRRYRLTAKNGQAQQAGRR